MWNYPVLRQKKMCIQEIKVLQDDIEQNEYVIK